MAMSRLAGLQAGAVALGLILVGHSHARIESDTVFGVWLFDDDKGNEALDSSRNERHGELTGGPVVVDGKFGGALEMSGGDTVKVPSLGLTLPTKRMTIVTWA